MKRQREGDPLQRSSGAKKARYQEEEDEEDSSDELISLLSRPNPPRTSPSPIDAAPKPVRSRRSAPGAVSEAFSDSIEATQVLRDPRRHRSSPVPVPSSHPPKAAPQSSLVNEAKVTMESSEAEITPTKRGRGRPRGPNWTPKKSKTNGAISTPTRGTNSKILASTPLRMSALAEQEETPTIVRNADRSARRKSARNLIERNLGENTSDAEDDEDELARVIYDEDLVENEEEEEIVLEGEGDPITPSKRNKKSKPARVRKRSPTPPGDLPPHELYFLQNKPGRQKTSDNTLASLRLLDHEEYFSLVRGLQEPHAEEIQYLEEFHCSSFNQWQFELSQGFSICIYGWGSKRPLLTKFAEHVYTSQSSDQNENNGIVVVNGYAHNTTIKDIFNTVVTAILGPSHNFKLGSQPIEMLETLLSLLSQAASSKGKGFYITLIINSIDARPLCQSATHTLLSRLATHPQIHLIVSVDHPNTAILWDSSVRSNFAFLFHDCTTFQPYEAEIDVVETVHALLGRSGRRVGGKEGVSFVLKSLPDNAKKLFGLLVAGQLADMEGGGANINDEEDPDGEGKTGLRRANVRNGNQEFGIEYRVLFQKAVEEFICSAEMGFRSLLKEFYDHQMIESRKDAMGTEILSVPFQKEELETILEDLMA